MNFRLANSIYVAECHEAALLEDHYNVFVIPAPDIRVSKMNALLIGVIALTVPLALCYDEKYDKIDVDKIIADDSLFNAYINCMLDKGPCDVENSEDFKKLLPEVIATSCAKCSPIQRHGVRKTVKALTEKKPDEFNQFRAKYDPKNEYEKDFTAFILATD